MASNIPKPFIIKATPPYAPPSSSSNNSISSSSSAIHPYTTTTSSYIPSSSSITNSSKRTSSPYKARQPTSRSYKSPVASSLANRANAIQQYIEDIELTKADEPLFPSSSTISVIKHTHHHDYSYDDLNISDDQHNELPYPSPSSTSSSPLDRQKREQSIHALTTKLNSTIEQLNTNRNLLSKLTEENTAMKARCSTLSQENKIINSKYLSLTDEHNQCIHEKVEIESHKAHIQVLENSIRQLSNVATEAMERIQTAETKAQHSIEQKKILEERINILEHRAITAEKQLQIAEGINLTADRRIATAERQVAAMEKRTVEAEKQVHIMERRMIEAEKRSNNAEKRVLEEELKNKELVNKHTKLEQIIEQLNNEIRDLNTRILDNESKIRIAQRKIDDAQKVAAEAQQGAAQAVSLLAEREQQLSALRETLVFAVSSNENTTPSSNTVNNTTTDKNRSESYDAILAAETSLDAAALTYEQEMHHLREQLLLLEQRAAQASGHTFDLSKVPYSGIPGGNSTTESTNNTNTAEDDGNLYDGIIPLKGPKTVDEMITNLRSNGLHESQLVIFIDCTKSNLTNGAKSFEGRSLHDITQPSSPNPYQTVITCVGKTLAPFDADNRIPCFGFGDRHSADISVFPFHTDPKLFCNGFEDVLIKYTEKIPSITLAGPTSFAPAIRKTMELVKSSKTREFTVCLIIADGQVNTVKETEAAIVESSRLPIAICVVGVGDGPWEQMYEFDHHLPARKFDNFRFVSFNSIVDAAKARKMTFDNAFALSVLAEIPEQYAQAKALRLL